MSRENAWGLLTEYVDSESLRKHCLSVEAAMRSYAEKFGENAELWGITGLLHDFDYEKYPDEHPTKGSGILAEQGYPEEMIAAILGHSHRTGVARESLLAKTLFAVDELCGMIVATAHVRPGSFDGMTASSVKKNLKKKAFAAAISREDIEQGIAELGIDRDEHIANVITALSGIKNELGFA